jgi:hypothetical protein
MRNVLKEVRLAGLVAASLLFAAFGLASSSGAQTASGTTAVVQETPPPPAAPRSVNVPKPVERTLPNGLRVIVIENHSTPLVGAQVLVKSGGEVDPQALSGLADMTAELLTKGTKRSRRWAANSTPAPPGTPRARRSTSSRRRPSRRSPSSPT